MFIFSARVQNQSPLSAVRFLRAMISIGHPTMFTHDDVAQVTKAFGENFSTWYFRNRSTLGLQPFPPTSVMPLSNYHKVMGGGGGFGLVQHAGPVAGGGIWGHWNLNPGAHGKRVLALMKKTGVTGVVAQVVPDGAIDGNGKVKPLKPVALPFTTYVHTNDPVGYVSFNGATPYATHGYVDITRLPSVLTHRKCGYDGTSNVSYRHRF